MADLDKIIQFQNTNFTNEPKDTDIRVRMSKRQKEALKMMAKARKMKVSELIMTLLQYEKETNMILNDVLEKQYKEGGE